MLWISSFAAALVGFLRRFLRGDFYGYEAASAIAVADGRRPLPPTTSNGMAFDDNFLTMTGTGTTTMMPPATTGIVTGNPPLLKMNDLNEIQKTIYYNSMITTCCKSTAELPNDDLLLLLPTTGFVLLLMLLRGRRD